MGKNIYIYKMRKDPLTFIFGNTGLHPIFLKFKQLIQTVQHDGYIKMYLQIKFYIFLNFFREFFFATPKLENYEFATPKPLIS
jgi:hypothetical protein